MDYQTLRALRDPNRTRTNPMGVLAECWDRVGSDPRVTLFLEPRTESRSLKGLNSIPCHLSPTTILSQNWTRLVRTGR